MGFFVTRIIARGGKNINWKVHFFELFFDSQLFDVAPLTRVGHFSYKISYAGGEKGGGMTADSTPRITALSPSQMARILGAAGQRRITEAMVKADLEAGAPANADGTLNLVHYAAWLAKQAGRRAQEGGDGDINLSMQERGDHGD